jgi:hypothetical protein
LACSRQRRVKDFNAFASGLRPRHTMEKPVTPEKLVSAICKMLEVAPAEAQAPPADSDRQAILNMLKKSDPKKLKKIRELISG